MSQSKLIKNFSATYVRAVFSAVLLLLASRWAFNAIGVESYGVFGAVSALVVAAAFLNNNLSTSLIRHFSYAIGENDTQALKGVLFTSLWFAMGLSFFYVIFGEIVGAGLFLGKVQIPEHLRSDSFVAYRVILYSMAIMTLAVPMIAFQAARQRFDVISAFGIAQSASIAGFSWWIYRFPGMGLVGYSIGWGGIMAFFAAMQILYSVRTEREVFRAGIIIPSFRYIKDIVSFSGWTIIGSAGVALRDQGSNLTLGYFYGPKMNAAFSVALQVGSQANQLAASLLNVFSPEITRSYAMGDLSRVSMMASRASRFASLLVMLFAVPTLAEVEYLLDLWLVVPPEYSATFCTGIILAFLVDRLTSGYVLAISAKGDIRWYQVIVGGVYLASAPVTFLMVGYLQTPVVVGWIIFFASIVAGMARVIWARRLLNASISGWIKSVFLPLAVIFLLGSATSAVTHRLMDESFLRLIFVAMLSCIVMSIASWLFLVTPEERNSIRLALLRKLKKGG